MNGLRVIRERRDGSEMISFMLRSYLSLSTITTPRPLSGLDTTMLLSRLKECNSWISAFDTIDEKILWDEKA